MEKKYHFGNHSFFLPREALDLPTNVVTCMEIEPNKPEFGQVKNYFYLTLPQLKNNNPNSFINEIVSVKRFIFTPASVLFEQNLSRVRDMHSSNLIFHKNIKYRLLLWHGSGNIDPLVYIKDGNVQNILNTNSTKGLWGKGFYFSSDASHAALNSFLDKITGNRRIILSLVITGVSLACPENSAIRSIPKGYNSLSGWKGSNIYYISPTDIYSVLPTYVVEWKSK